MILQIIFCSKIFRTISAKNHLLILYRLLYDPYCDVLLNPQTYSHPVFIYFSGFPFIQFSSSEKMRKAKRLTKRIQKAFVLESSVSPVPPPRKSLSSTELTLSALSSSQKSESSHHSNHRRSSSNEDVSIESDDSDRDSGLFLKTKSYVTTSRG